MFVECKVSQKHVFQKELLKTRHDISVQYSTHYLLKVKISAHRPKNFASKCLILIYWIVINENRDLLGHLKTMPIPIMLRGCN